MFIGVFLALAGAFTQSVSFIAGKKRLEVAEYKLFILARIVIGLLFSTFLLWTLGPGLSNLTIKGVLPFVLTSGLGGGFGIITVNFLTSEKNSPRNIQR